MELVGRQSGAATSEVRAPSILEAKRDDVQQEAVGDIAVGRTGSLYSSLLELHPTPRTPRSPFFHRRCGNLLVGPPDACFPPDWAETSSAKPKPNPVHWGCWCKRKCVWVMHVKCIHKLCTIIHVFHSYLHHIRGILLLFNVFC